MVDNLLVQDLLPVVLLWLGALLYEGWIRHRSATCPTRHEPALPTQQRSQEPKPFPGLTHKPRCAACEQAPAPGPLSPVLQFLFAVCQLTAALTPTCTDERDRLSE